MHTLTLPDNDKYISLNINADFAMPYKMLFGLARPRDPTAPFSPM